MFAKKEIIIFSLYIFLTCKKALRGIILRAIIGSLQEVTVSNFFFDETYLESPLSTRMEYKRKLREKKAFQEAIAATEDFELSFTNKNCIW